MILVKHSPSYQISHLYRLLYRKSIDDFFHSKGLYRSLDYLVYGTTYYKGGVIAIEIDFITEEAKKLAEKIKKLDVATDTTGIGIGFLQSMTEQKQLITAPGGIDKVKEALKDLHIQPWQEMNSLEMLDMRSAETEGGALILQKATLPRLRTLTVNFSLDRDIVDSRPEFTPLFEQLVYLLDQNSWNSISMKYGIFSKGIGKPQNKGEFVLPSRFKVHPQLHELMEQWRTLEDIAYDYVDFVYEYREDKAFDRYLHTLQRAAYDTDLRRLLPGPGLVADTGFVVGARGWQKIATAETCELLFKNMTISVRYDRKQMKLPALYHEQ